MSHRTLMTRPIKPMAPRQRTKTDAYTVSPSQEGDGKLYTLTFPAELRSPSSARPARTTAGRRGGALRPGGR
jgi:hypothetical protein